MRVNLLNHVTDFTALSTGAICIAQLPDIGAAWCIKTSLKETRGYSEKLLVFRVVQAGQQMKVKPHLMDADAAMLEQRVLDITAEVVFSPMFDLESALPDMPLVHKRAGMVVMVRDQVLLCVDAPHDDSYGQVVYLNISSGELSRYIGENRQSENLLLKMGMYYLTRHWQLRNNDQDRVLLDSFEK